MRYHDITKDDMKNGDGLRVVLWVSGCSHHCKGCQNPQTWNPDGGITFDEAAKKEVFEELEKDYVSGITFSGGDPLHQNNAQEILALCKEIKEKYPDKTIWLYSGYTIEEIRNGCADADEHYFIRRNILEKVDVFVDGRYEEDKRDTSLPWVGSSNQRVIRKEPI